MVDLKVHTTGGIVGPREPLLDIVPRAQKLIVSARIEVNSVDNVRTGRDCDLRLSAFKTRTTPLIPCTLTYLSADRLEDSTNHAPYYLAHVEFDRKALAAADVALTAGMPAEVYIKTRSRTALQYLLEPITVFLRHSIQDT